MLTTRNGPALIDAKARYLSKITIFVHKNYMLLLNQKRTFICIILILAQTILYTL